jgi:hypothetical protein
MKGFSRLILLLTLGALLVSALIAIYGVLTQDFGEWEGRLVLIVVSVWVFSLAFVAGLRAVARGGVVQALGLATEVLAAAGLAFTVALIVVWRPLDEGVGRAWSTVLIVGLSLAHASYLLGARRSERILRVVVGATIAVEAIAATLLLAMTTDLIHDPGAWLRVVAVFFILTALGDLALPVIGRLRRAPVSAAPPAR